jgi:hypothetical protein
MLQTFKTWQFTGPVNLLTDGSSGAEPPNSPGSTAESKSCYCYFSLAAARWCAYEMSVSNCRSPCSRSRFRSFSIPSVWA